MKSNGGEQKVCMKWIQFRPWLKPCDAKVSSLLSRSFLAVLAFLLISH